ncbi:MAG: glycosyltransferase family 39 protein [Eubacterium sp.]|nr:glycosyltransferase family 39 protein [Eubacterium sp.]
MNNTKDYEKYSKILLPFGIGIRIVFFIINLFVGGYNSDEVMTSLNAVSLAEKGTDIMGERLPVYFDTWVIGGQSPFATYLSALGIKLFGFNDFGVRIFALVFSIIAFLALYGFAKEVFKNSEYTAALTGLGCVCPWAVFSGAYVLDCNYLGHILIIALYFFARAINGDKTRFYILSMLFFALGFYCYIASVLFIPALLLTLYLVLLIKKRISFKNAAISVITVFVAALPFILFGLVSSGIIKPFEFFGFSFSDMPGYERTSQTLFTYGNGPFIVNMFGNLFASLFFTVLSDSAYFALGVNVFSFGGILCGLLFLTGLIYLFFMLIKKNKGLDFNQKLFALSFFTAFIFFAATVSHSGFSTMYRNYVFSYIILYFSAIGYVQVRRHIKKAQPKKALSIYLSLCFATFCFVYGGIYANQISPSEKGSRDLFLYGDSYYACLDYAKDNGYLWVKTYKTESSKYQPGVFLRHYYYDDIDYFNPLDKEFRDEIKDKTEDGAYKIKKDATQTYTYIKKGDTLSGEFCIVESREIKNLKISDEYEIKDFGFWSAVYKDI